MQAYEVSTVEIMDEDKKQVANEEVVLTSELSDNESVDEDDAVDFINLIKKGMGDRDLESEEDIRALIEELAKESGFDLTEEEINKLVSLFNKFKDLDIDWDSVNQKINEATENVKDFLNSEEGGSFIESKQKRAHKFNFLDSEW